MTARASLSRVTVLARIYRKFGPFGLLPGKKAG